MRYWTKEETEYLSEKWGALQIKRIAKKLNRSTGAIQQKASKLKLGAFLEANEYIPLNQLLAIINGGIQYGYYLPKLIKLNFPIKEIRVLNNSFKVVYMDEFFEWFENHKHNVFIHQTDDNDFGPEPEWLKEKRKADKLLAKYKKTKWTDSEKERLIALLKQFKYGYKELAHLLMRTETAIKRQILTLKIKERPLRDDNKKKWSEFDNQRVKTMYLKGYEAQVIADLMNKSALAVQGIIERNNFYKEAKKTGNFIVDRFYEVY